MMTTEPQKRPREQNSVLRTPLQELGITQRSKQCATAVSDLKLGGCSTCAAFQPLHRATLHQNWEGESKQGML